MLSWIGERIGGFTICGFSNLGVLIVSLILLYLSFPIIFRCCPYLQRKSILMNHLDTNLRYNIKEPGDFGLKSSRALKLKATNRSLYPEGMQLGGWHILPKSRYSSTNSSKENSDDIVDDSDAFLDERPIVLYLHGNGGNRAGPNRIHLYQRLSQEFDYHVIAFDYRGFGDSYDLAPSSDSLNADADFVYRWLLEQPGVTKDRMIVWGHSLGTSIALRMVANLEDELKPRRIVLEAPFDILFNEVLYHPASVIFSILPYWRNCIILPIVKNPALNFDSMKHIVNIKTTPIVIIHAEDDIVIPYKLGRNLYNLAVDKLGESKVKFITVDRKESLGHGQIVRHTETMTKIKDFIESSIM